MRVPKTGAKKYCNTAGCAKKVGMPVFDRMLKTKWRLQGKTKKLNIKGRTGTVENDGGQKDVRVVKFEKQQNRDL
jgi:hypothetical protein